MTGDGMIRKVVLPNVACILLSVGYVVFMLTVLVPQMDVKHSDGDAFVVLLGLLFSIYGVCISVERIVNAYNEKWERERNNYLAVKNTFALFNKDYWNPEWTLRDLPNDLSEAVRLGIDKELPTARDCRLYLFGWDPEENRPPRPKFNSKHTMIEVDGKWHDIPDKFYGRLMDDATVDQIVSEIRSNAGGYHKKKDEPCETLEDILNREG